MRNVILPVGLVINRPSSQKARTWLPSRISETNPCSVALVSVCSQPSEFHFYPGQQALYPDAVCVWFIVNTIQPVGIKITGWCLDESWYVRPVGEHLFGLRDWYFFVETVAVRRKQNQ